MSKPFNFRVVGIILMLEGVFGIVIALMRGGVI